MSPIDPLADNPPNEPRVEGIRGNIQKLDEVRSSVDSQEEMLHDKGLNPTMTFEEGCSGEDAMWNAFSLTTTRYLWRHGASLGSVQLHYVDVSPMLRHTLLGPLTSSS